MKWLLSGSAAQKEKRILALLFGLFVLMLSVVAAPKAAREIMGAMEGKSLSIRGIATALDGAYRDLLEIEGPPVANKAAYVSFNGLLSGLMGQRIMNDCVKLNNGHLGGIGGTPDLGEQWNSIVALAERQRAAGKQFLFVLAPGQNSKYEGLSPAGTENASNAAADHMADWLRERGVPLLDLRDALHDQGISSADSFFVTDLHWKPETAFWAHGQILQALEPTGIIAPVPETYSSLESFEVKVLRDWFLGSSGKRTGRFFAGLDDFSIITPRFATHLITEIPSRKQRLEGSFAETALDWPRVNEKGYFTNDPYAMYGFGNPDRMRYQNPESPAPQKLLWIGDSFGSPVVPYQALVFREVEDIDMRYYTGDFAAFYEAYQPDAVVLLVNITSILQENATYDFFPQ